MILRKTISNDDVRECLRGSSDVYADVLSSMFDGVDDEQLAVCERVVSVIKSFSQLDRDIFYLYSTVGSSRAAELLGVSRQYICMYVKRLKKEIGL